MIIGTFKATENGFAGQVTTLEFDRPVTITTIAKAKTSEKSPDYHVFSKRVHVGAAWKEHSDSGVDYVRVAIDDPSLREPIYGSLFGVTDGDGFQLIWNRPRKQTATAE